MSNTKSFTLEIVLPKTKRASRNPVKAAVLTLDEASASPENVRAAVRQYYPEAIDIINVRDISMAGAFEVLRG